MDVFTIKDVENLTGIKAHTIRIWEQRYSFLQPGRTDTNIRYYSGKELQKLLAVALLNRNGYRISQISEMSEREMNERIGSLPGETARQTQIINRLITDMVTLQLGSFEEALRRYQQEKGIESLIRLIIFPFLEKIGMLWLTSHIRPSHEHLVSNIIRQKIIAGIDILPVDDCHAKALLFLPEGEHHEIALLYLQYMLRKKGLSVWYLGADTPLTELAYIVSKTCPNYLFTHITAPGNSFRLERYLRQLHDAVPKATTFVSGVFAQSYQKKVPSNVRILRSLPEVLALISSL